MISNTIIIFFLLKELYCLQQRFLLSKHVKAYVISTMQNVQGELNEIHHNKMWEVLSFAELCYIQLELHKLLFASSAHML